MTNDICQTLCSFLSFSPNNIKNDRTLWVLMVISVKLRTVYKLLACGKRENVKYQNSLLALCEAPGLWSPLLANFSPTAFFFSQHHIRHVLSLLPNKTNFTKLFFLHFIYQCSLFTSWPSPLHGQWSVHSMWPAVESLSCSGILGARIFLFFNDSCQSSIGQVHVLLTCVRYTASQNWSPENAASPSCHSLCPPLKQRGQVKRLSLNISRPGRQQIPLQNIAKCQQSFLIVGQMWNMHPSPLLW